MNERKQFVAEHPILVGIFIGWMAMTGSIIMSFVMYAMMTAGSLV